MTKILLIVFVILLAFSGFYFFNQNNTKINNPITPSANNNSIDLNTTPAISAVAENLTVPWAMDFLPDGKIIFTERGGKVNIIDNGTVKSIGEINVHSVSESGLHGIAVDPDYSNNNTVFLYYTYQSSGNNSLNRVSKFILENDSLKNEQVIVDQIPGAPNHDGGRIKFGPDGYLYITTGDAQEPSLAQNKNSLAGKILRITKSGKTVPGNSFNNLVFTYGHRNPQGITWDDEKKIWATEHGRSGALSGFDELNMINSGSNYGWPEIQGDETQDGMNRPIIHSANDTWAPGGAAFYDGKIYFTGLRGSALYEYNIDTKELNEYAKEKYGRLRDIVVGPDGFFYISTSNRDGRGRPNSQDDKILKINPQKLSEL